MPHYNLINSNEVCIVFASLSVQDFSSWLRAFLSYICYKLKLPFWRLFLSGIFISFIICHGLSVFICKVLLFPESHSSYFQNKSKLYIKVNLIRSSNIQYTLNLFNEIFSLLCWNWPDVQFEIRCHPSILTYFFIV